MHGAHRRKAGDAQARQTQRPSGYRRCDLDKLLRAHRLHADYGRVEKGATILDAENDVQAVSQGRDPTAVKHHAQRRAGHVHLAQEEGCLHLNGQGANIRHALQLLQADLHLGTLVSPSDDEAAESHASAVAPVRDTLREVVQAEHKAGNHDHRKVR